MSQNTPPGKKRGLTRPIEVVRAELLKDPETKRIAKAVGMELEAYVELVLEYAQDKDKQPMLNVVEDEELRSVGYNPPSSQDVANFFIEGAKGNLGTAGAQFQKSEFTASSGPGGKPTLSSTPAATPELKGNPALMDQIKKGGGKV